MSEERASAVGPRCLTWARGCPSPREQELLGRALSMDTALRMVRYTLEAEGGGGTVATASVLRAISRPYRFPIPGDAEALAAYRQVYGHGDRLIAHLAAAGRGHEGCEGCGRAQEADEYEALRDHGGWPPWEQPRRGAVEEGGGGVSGGEQVVAGADRRRKQAMRYLAARFGPDWVYQPPEAIGNVTERWIWSVANGQADYGEECIEAIEGHCAGRQA